jgi:hypothetical protein
MKRMFLVALVLSAGTALAASTTQKWTAGWDNFGEPLNYSKSKVTWSVNTKTRKLTVKSTLVGARPDKYYQLELGFFCETIASTFGQFPTDFNSNGNCLPTSKQDVNLNTAGAELGAVLTDIHGNGSFSVVVGPIASGTYTLEFTMRDGAGCMVGGGGGACNIDFQSPGPTFGDTITITIP